jgi:methyl-accepting chemotaxis protein
MKNLTIGTRLAAGFGLVLALMILMTVIGIGHMSTVATATRDMMQQPLAKERMISDWYRLIHTSVRRTSAISKSSDPSLGPFFAEETASSTAEVNGLQKKVEPLLESDEEKALFKGMMENRKRYLSSRDAIVALKKEGKFEEAAQVLDQRFTPDGKAYLTSLSSLLDLQRKSIDANAERIETLYESNRTFMIGLGLMVLTLGVVCAWRLTPDARHHGAAEPGGGDRRGRGAQRPDLAYRSHQQG